MSGGANFVAGIDVGTECVKVLILQSGESIVGRAVVATRGYFQDRVREALAAAVDDARIEKGDLQEIGGTGFGANCAPMAGLFSGETACHALGSYHHFPFPHCVVDIGGREPRVMQVDDEGRPTEIHTLRRCAVGIGTFLMFAARHLDVHPTRLQELAAAADEPAGVGSYCSVFAGSDVLDRLREGATRETVALGCMHSVAERIVEIGGFSEPLRISGGVAEYFPGVIKSLSEITQMKVEIVPEPIMVGALGAALQAARKVAQRHGSDEKDHTAQASAS